MIDRDRYSLINFLNLGFLQTYRNKTERLRLRKGTLLISLETARSEGLLVAKISILHTYLRKKRIIIGAFFNYAIIF